MTTNIKTYAIINITDLALIDFSQIGETSASTIRKSIDETQFVIKYKKGYTPLFIMDGSVTPVKTYNHAGVLELMATPKWSEEIEE
jgi:hypothetical protein